MRYLFGFLGACALGAMTLVDCAWDPGQDDCWSWDRPCDGDGCPACDGVVCEDDGDECTEDVCICATGTCGGPVAGGTVCDFNGLPGACIEGVCEEDVWCEGACDDGSECTVNICRIESGECDDTTVIGDGTVCGGGFCRDGRCETLVDQCTTGDLAAIEAGDEPDADEIVACREDWNAVGGGEEELGCLTVITNCLQESGTSLSAECSSCFALRECCMVYECGCESPDPRCDKCLEESCQPLVDACVGGQ